MFPICDEQGRVIGFSGRVLSGDEKTAKYVNSPETPIFTKGKVLYALDKAKRTILDVGCVVVCEGQLDTIACHAKGVTHAVAPQGTALTAHHVRILQRYTNDIILCFDGDNAGRKAAARGFDELIALGVPFRVAEIPPPEDPDSFLRKFGLNAFMDLLVQARDFFDWYLDYLCESHQPSTDRGRIAIVEAMARVLDGRNKVLVDTYTQRTAMRLRVSTEAVRAEIKGIPTAANVPRKDRDAAAKETAKPEPPSPHEYWLLKLLLQHDYLVPWAAAHLDPGWVQHSLVRQIVSKRLAAHAKDTWSSLAALLDECDTPELRSLVTETTTEPRPLPNPAQQLADVTLRLRNQFIDRQFAVLMQRANQPEVSEAERNDLLRQQQELRCLKRQPIQGGD
jgi:DNA primase